MKRDLLFLHASELLLEMLTANRGLAWEVLVRLHAEDGENFKTIRRKGARHEQRVANLLTNRLLDAERQLSSGPDRIIGLLEELDRAANEYTAIQPQDRLLYFADSP